MSDVSETAFLVRNVTDSQDASAIPETDTLKRAFEGTNQQMEGAETRPQVARSFGTLRTTQNTPSGKGWTLRGKTELAQKWERGVLGGK